MVVNVELTKNDVSEIKEGQKATITILDKKYTGKVTYISHVAVASADGSTKTISAEISIDNPDKDIILGIDAKVVIDVMNEKDVMTIPYSLVNVDGNFVYVVKKDVITKQYVELGINDGDKVVIKDGLDDKDMVLTNVDKETKEGEKVVAKLIDMDSVPSKVEGVNKEAEE